MDELSRKRTVVRHDSVTARAISRLSHGVSQLTACSTNAITPRCMFRSRRSKLSTNETSKKRVPFDHRSPTVEQPSPTLDCVQENRSASKRKWQSDKPPSHNNMDVDEVPPSLHSAKASPNSCPVACFDVMASEHCFLPASCQYSDRCRFICSDNFDLRAASPSCSSMLSLTASSVDETDSDSSQQQEADAEDEDDKQQSVSLKKKSSLSYTDLLGIPFSSTTIRGMQSDKRSGKLLLPPKHHNQGGDSSDGLPFGVKIPRLTVDSTSSISTSSNQRQGNLKNENFHGSSRNQAVLLYATNMMNQHTYPSEKAISNSSRKSGRLRCVHSEFQLVAFIESYFLPDKQLST
ncbi:unnamed protein product [Dicrocoelium dendriticum]|nr:unnamed protein product [Dicrocoelium dendriticum]